MRRISVPALCWFGYRLSLLAGLTGWVVQVNSDGVVNELTTMSCSVLEIEWKAHRVCHGRSDWGQWMKEGKEELLHLRQEGVNTGRKCFSVVS